MAKVLYSGDWYEQLASEALYEEEFENILMANADHLFPSHFLVPFKKLVYTEASAAKPDFALIHRRYVDWWVVEAEMSHHSFSSHVQPQVETLSRAVYDESVAEYLSAQRPEIETDKMRSAVKGVQPRVLVVVNAPMPTWQRELRPLNALVTVLEIFRSRHNKHLFRLNGEQPEETALVRSDCTVELARFLRVHSPGVLPIRHGEVLPIQFRGGVTAWSRMDLQDRVYLCSSKPVSLEPDSRLSLIEREDGSFSLEKKRS